MSALPSSAVEMPAWAQNQFDLRSEMNAWIEFSMRWQRGTPWYGIHDEGTFAESWFSYYLMTGNRDILDFLYHMRDGFLKWSDTNFYHGYYPEGEAHHQVETFFQFLCHFWSLDEDRERDIEIVEDAAHHVGNWVPGIPAWYDWERHRMLSYWLGTRTVRDEPPYDYECFDHFRFIKICLNTYLATGDPRYLEWSVDYADGWRDVLMAPHHAPMVFRFCTDDPEEIDHLYFTEEAKRKIGRGFDIHSAVNYALKRGANWEELREDYNGALGRSTAMIESLQELFVLTGEDRFLETSLTLMDRFEEHSRRTAPRRWKKILRATTGNTRYDAELQTVPGDTDAPPPDVMLIESPFANEHPTQSWGNREANETVVPYTGPDVDDLVTAYRLSGDISRVKHAYRLARPMLHMARVSLRDGREHGCASGNFAAGPGRTAGYALTKTALGYREFCCTLRPKILYRHDGVLGLPEKVAAIYLPEGDNKRVVRLYNAGEESVELGVCAKDTDRKITSATVDGEPHMNIKGNVVSVKLLPGREYRVAARLG
ncbi:MAG: hypothetical protein ACLFWL_16825 [Candidatus Brocadiia bacterium]